MSVSLTTRPPLLVVTTRSRRTPVSSNFGQAAIEVGLYGSVPSHAAHDSTECEEIRPFAGSQLTETLSDGNPARS